MEPSPKRKRKYATSFSNVSQEEAESTLGLELADFYYHQTPLGQFVTAKAPDELKKKIFERLMDCILSEGFPEATISPMNESVVTDNVGIILQAMVSHFVRVIGRSVLKLSREKQIISKDEQVGGNMEFIVTHSISTRKIRYVLVVEAKRDSLGKGLIQLLLALKSISEINNDQQMVYGFLTTGIDWQLVTSDGGTWKLSRPSTLLIGNMDANEAEWLRDNTQILDVLYSIFSSL